MIKIISPWFLLEKKDFGINIILSNKFMRNINTINLIADIYSVIKKSFLYKY